MTHPNTFGSRATLTVAGRQYTIFRLASVASLPGSTVDRLPFSLKILLENLLRNEDNAFVKRADVEALARWDVTANAETEIAFRTSRVLLQDFTGVPCVVDLAAMRDAMVALGGDPTRINPLQPVDLVIDHSVQVDEYGSDAAFLINTEREFERNRERYEFLRWGQNALDNFRVVPPGTGICHQVNLEYLGRVVFTSDADGATVARFRHVRAAARGPGGVVGGAQQPALGGDVVQRLLLVPDVVAGSHHVHAVLEKRIADVLGDAKAGGRVLRVGDHEVHAVVGDEPLEPLAQELTARPSDDVADEEQPHATGVSGVTTGT